MGGLPFEPFNLLSLKKISVLNFLIQKQISAKETFCLRCYFSSRCVRLKTLTLVSLSPELSLCIDFFFFFAFPPSKTLHLLSSPTSSCWFRFGLKLVKKKNQKNASLENNVDCQDAWVKQPCAQRKSRFSCSDFFSVCVFVCVFWCVPPSRWWAWTLIKRLSPEEALQVRAKVATLEALKGHRADMGLLRAWEGNYLVSVMDCFSLMKQKQLMYHQILCIKNSQLLKYLLKLSEILTLQGSWIAKSSGPKSCSSILK